MAFLMASGGGPVNKRLLLYTISQKLNSKDNQHFA